MNRRQRTVLVIAMGLTVATLVNAFNQSRSIGLSGGWFNYTPTTSAIFDGDRSAVWREALAWLVGIAVWGTAAVLIYRRDPD